MTITNPTRVVTATGNGATTIFPYTFLIPEASDLVVILYDTVTSIATTLDPSQYSATGLGDEAGGSVTYPLTGTPLSSTEKISILRTMPYEQGLDVDGENAYNPALLESQLDKIVMQIQQVAEEVGRAVTVPVGLGVSSEDYFQTLATFAATQIGLIDTAGSDAVTAIAADKAAADADAAAAYTSELNAASSAASAAASALSVAPLPDQINAATDTAFADADMLTARKTADGSLIKRSWANLKVLLASTFLPLTGGALTGDLSLGGNNLQGVAAVNGGPLENYRNKLINGDFDIWQAGISQTGTGVASDDRWYNTHAGTTATHSQQKFALGQTVVPGNPVNFSRTVVTSVAGAGNYAVKYQKIEGAQILSGRQATITFYAKADAARNIALEMQQQFGAGGSTVVSVPIGLVALTTAWKRYDLVVTIPSIAGKVLGTGGDSVQLNFWFDAGSTLAANSSGLGQQSGTFDIAHVSIVQGDATGEGNPFGKRHVQQELALCQRYAYFPNNTGYIACSGAVSGASGALSILFPFPVQMRAVPTLAYNDMTDANYANTTNPTGHQWSSQIPGVAGVGKTGALTVGASTNQNWSTIYAYGQLNGTPSTVVMGVGFVMPSWQAEL